MSEESPCYCERMIQSPKKASSLALLSRDLALQAGHASLAFSIVSAFLKVLLRVAVRQFAQKLRMWCQKDLHHEVVC